MSQTVADRSTGPIATTGVATARRVLTSDAALIVGASLLMAICAHVSIPLWFTPVPITLQTFGVILLALTLGGPRASAALALYLAEGMVGLPVFSPGGAGGMAHIFGPTGGYLMAYPSAALAAGFLAEKLSSRGRMAALTAGALAAEVVIFGSGILWLMFILRTSLTLAYHGGVLPFLPGELLKIAAAVGIAYKSKRLIA